MLALQRCRHTCAAEMQAILPVVISGRHAAASTMAPPLAAFFAEARAGRPSRTSAASASAYAPPPATMTATAATVAAPDQPSRLGRVLMLVIGLGALVAGLWWKVHERGAGQPGAGRGAAARAHPQERRCGGPESAEEAVARR